MSKAKPRMRKAVINRVSEKTIRKALGSSSVNGTPHRRFAISQVVDVSPEVHPSRRGRIVGLGTKNGSHLYYLLFSQGEGGRVWEATEEELMKWQGGSGS